MSFLSYAQNFEDVLLHRVFGGQETGFYVDVGAYHPVNGSTTKAFYDRGWSGINIEPGSVFAELEAARPRDVNLRMAVIDRAGEVAFIEDENDRGISYVIMDEATADTARLVPCDTLEAIVRAHARGRPVDFIKVDAEGAEGAIVRSTDWRRLRPRVLLLEATRPWSSVLANQDWEPVLLEHGYIRTYFDGINCFYVPEEELPALLRHFQVPVNVLDSVVYRDEVLLREQLQSQSQEVARLKSERDVLRTELVEQQAEAARLASERAALQTALAEQQARTALLVTEHDALRTGLADQQARTALLVTERDALRSGMTEQQAEAARLAMERGAVQASLAQQHTEVARLATELAARDVALQDQRNESARLAEAVRELAARLAPPGPSPIAAPPLSRGNPRRSARRAAKAAYKLARPVIRPLVWRLRSFITSGLSEQIRLLGERIDTLSIRPPPPPQVIHIRDDGAAAEMRHLAVEMEKTLLTLTLERGPAWAADPPAPPESARELQRVTLPLPDASSVSEGIASAVMQTTLRVNGRGTGIMSASYPARD